MVGEDDLFLLREEGFQFLGTERLRTMGGKVREVGFRYVTETDI